MDLNFAPPAEVTELAQRVADFVKAKVVPYEKDPRWTAHGPTEELRLELNALARAAGVFAPHVPEEFGGLGLSHIAAGLRLRGGRLFASSARSRSHCAAPDEGNIHLLRRRRDARRSASVC